ncbi:hypothetical protein HZS_5129 [Henneguya salminicola]|nr:hypothetical protein HZS_5129 [Henneguya salminicola]
MSFRNKIFLLYEGLEKDGERFILFATPRQLNIHSRNLYIYFDSSFKSVPEIFYQLFIIHGEYNNVLIPCVFENVEITCQTAMCDFEKASINSFMFCYPSTPLTGFFSPSANVYGAAFKMLAAVALIKEDR